MSKTIQKLELEILDSAIWEVQKFGLESICREESVVMAHFVDDETIQLTLDILEAAELEYLQRKLVNEICNWIFILMKN